MSAFSLRSNSPDGATTDCGDNIKLQLTTHLSTRKDKRLSWPSWLTYSRRFTHISGHQSAVVEHRTVKDRQLKIPLSHGDTKTVLLISPSSRPTSHVICGQVELRGFTCDAKSVVLPNTTTDCDII